MYDKPAAPMLRLVGANDDHRDGTHAEQSAFRPTIHMDDIFREMIRMEIRCGRLSPWRRRRIVQYAAQLNLSAVQAGRLIEECREELYAEWDSVPGHTLVVEEDSVTGRSIHRNTACIVVGLALILVAFTMM